jgi:hypothetical protein
VESGVSWNFDGMYHITSVSSQSDFYVTSSSLFTYFNPTQIANGGHGQCTVLTAPEPIAEIHNITASPNGILFETTVAYSQGGFVVTLQDNSPILTTRWNQIQNPNQLSAPVLSQLYVRLIDTQSYYGTQFNGLYQIAAVLGPNQFEVLPKYTQFLPNDYGGGGLCEILATLSMATPAGFVDTSDAALMSSPVAGTVAPILADIHNSSTLPSGTYHILYTFVTESGETPASPSSSITISTSNTDRIEVFPPTQTDPRQIGYNVYAHNGGGIFYLQNTSGPISLALSLFLRAPILLSGSVPPTTNPPGSYVTDDVMLQMSYTAKMGAVRTEFFNGGYYIGGNKVSLPTSPVDGYRYSKNEIGYAWSFVSSSPVLFNNANVGQGEFTGGTKYFPWLNVTNGETLLVVPYVIFIDQDGNVTCQVYTNSGQQNDWGVLQVIIIGTRLSVPTQIPPQVLAPPP